MALTEIDIDGGGRPVAGVADVGTAGVAGDRGLATGRVATAKHPRLWRSLLRFTAATNGAGVVIALPDGRVVAATDERIDEILSALLGREVRLSADRPAGAEVERPAPEDVLEHGVTAEVPFALLELGQGTPGATFVDYAPLHLITTGTLAGTGAEALRYRPNLVLDRAGPAFAENGWVGRDIRIGGVRLRGTLPTPRCSVPTLEHGELPRAPHAVRVPLASNRVDVPGSGVLPCPACTPRCSRAARSGTATRSRWSRCLSQVHEPHQHRPRRARGRDDAPIEDPGRRMELIDSSAGSSRPRPSRRGAGVPRRPG